jgi:hypothetical protein
MANTTVMNISKGPHSAKVIRQSANPYVGYLVKFYTNNKYHGDVGDYETGGYPVKEQQETALQDAIGTAKNTLHRLASHSGHGHHELIIDDKRRGSNLRENVLLEYKRTYADGAHDSARIHTAGWNTYVALGALVPGGVYLGGELAQNLGLPKLAGQIPGGLAGGVGSFIFGDALSRLTYGKSPSERALIKQNKLPVGSKVTYPDPNLGPVGQNNYGKPVKGTVVKHNKETLKTTVQRERDGKHIIVSSHHLDPA